MKPGLSPEERVELWVKRLVNASSLTSHPMGSAFAKESVGNFIHNARAGCSAAAIAHHFANANSKCSIRMCNSEFTARLHCIIRSILEHEGGKA